jgi:hypothetical protein
MPFVPTSTIRSRQIVTADREHIVALLARGFPVRSQRYWQRAFDALTVHPTPPGLPRYGYLLENAGTPVGVILLIFSSISHNGVSTLRCNVSSWYVEPDFRSFAPLLISQATKHRDVTYVNVSPAQHTRPIIEAQGFARYSDGQFVCIPALSPNARDRDARILPFGSRLPPTYQRPDLELLEIHRHHGCLTLWGVAGEEAVPFVLLPYRLRGIVPCVQLVYCRDIGELTRFARPLGRYLLRRGWPVLIIDASGPVPGLIGKYFGGKSPKYFKGPHRPSFGDLAFTEAVLFGW